MSIDEIIHLLGEEELPQGAMVPPIMQTSNFSISSIEELRSFFTNEWENHLYTRGNNPTVKILRQKLSALERTDDAICFSSGIAAVSAAILSEVKSGDHVICVKNPYSWTRSLLESYMPKYGVETTFVDGKELESIQAAKRDNTRLLMLESPNSMVFELQDLKACASWAKNNEIVTIIDNSYCSPLFQNPSTLGIDMIVHSGSKYLNGHSDVVFGVLCSAQERIARIAADEYMTLGAIMSPFEAFLVIRGLRTLSIRMNRINKSTMEIFDYLKSHPVIERIFYPFDPQNPQYDLARSQMSGSPGLLSIRLKTSERSEIEEFVHGLNVFRMGVSWGGHESLALPILAAHDIPGRQPPNLPINHIRLYVGLEDPDTLISDLDQNLRSISS
ncbi:MAG: PLP-dependent aspartate aminotransferase family protein [Saprospiraceae bacterium]|nr:PLP-dependent aspartate aminotransferase family protein [Saprospiraceae bacterium]